MKKLGFSFNAFRSRVASFTVLILMLCMSVVMPMKTVFAYSGSGTGTSNDPFMITNCNQLQSMADDLSAHYKLGNNIDCSDTVNWNGGKGFDPVGVGITHDQDYNEIPAVPFTGSLDGAGHTISNLTILRANDTPDDYGAPEDEEYVGIFGATYNATIQNIHVRSSKIKGWQYVGGIIGSMDGGILKDSSFNVTTADNSCDPGNCVWARYGYAGGGLVGNMASGTITNSTTGGPVKGSGVSIGGLVGVMNAGTLSNSSSSSYTDGGSDIGGAVGYMGGGTISHAYASGNAHANVDESSGKNGRNVGGFVGRVGGGTITDAYATGDVTTDYNPAGGFVGYMSAGSISNAYASGSVTANTGQANIGGFVGTFYSFQEETKISNSFAVSKINAPGGVGGFAGYHEDLSPVDPLVNVYYDAARTGKNICYARSNASDANGEFRNPTHVAVDSSNNLYVVDYGNNRIQKFDSSGNYVTQWGTAGTGNGQFSGPYGIAVDPTSNVYVLEYNNSRIQKFDSSGNYITQWGTAGNGVGELNNAQAIAIDSSNNIYVSDTNNNRIQKFNSSGTYISQWGTLGEGNGQFQYPRGVAIDSSNNIYVSDTNNSRIQKFSSTGTYITQWGINGTGNGEFSGPQGLTLDTSSNVYVTDAYNNRIQKFNSSGTYISQWGTLGAGNGELNGPTGIARNSSGDFFVADTGNNRIQKFDSSGTYIRQWAGPTTGNNGCTSVNTSSSDPSYFYNAVHEPFAGSWDNSLWQFSGTSYPAFRAADQDNDGVPNSVENQAPNNGDGNNDGILDSTQVNVASWLDAVTGKYVTLVAPAGVIVTATSDLKAPTDQGYLYPFGLVGFTVGGVSPGGTVSMSIIYQENSTKASSLIARKFFPGTQSFKNIPSPVISNDTVAGKGVVKLEYSLTDGGSLDLDGSANGSITDPVGLATSGTLAATGMNRNAAMLFAYALIGASLAIIFVLRSRKV